MTTKNLMLMTVLTLSAATGVAQAASANSAQQNAAALPLSPVQKQLLMARPAKTAEFARFEAVAVRAKKAGIDQGRAISPSQAQVLGNKLK
jgi:hypothetical protein